MLEHLYTTKQNAESAVKKAWNRILEVRDIIRENSEEPWKPTQAVVGAEAA